MNRPTGITVLAVLNFAGAGALALAGLLVLALGGAVADIPLFAAAGAVIGVIFLASAALTGALAWGLWTLMGWAWIVEVVLLALGALSVVAAATDVGNLIGLAISGLVLFYLFRPHVRAAFGRA